MSAVGFVLTFSTIAAHATVNVHAAGCSAATKRDGRVAWPSKCDTLAAALAEAKAEAAETGRKAKACACTRGAR